MQFFKLGLPHVVRDISCDFTRICHAIYHKNDMHCVETVDFAPVVQKLENLSKNTSRVSNAKSKSNMQTNKEGAK